MAAEAALRGLLVDWGGVLTTNVFASFESFCRREGLDAELVRDMFRDDPEARAHAVRARDRRADRAGVRGRASPQILGLREDRAPGLIDRLFGGMTEDLAMFDRGALRQGAGRAHRAAVELLGRRPLRPLALPAAVRRRRDQRRGGHPQARPRDLRAGDQAHGAAARPRSCSSTTSPATSSRRGSSAWRRVHHSSGGETVTELERLLGLRLRGI